MKNHKESSHSWPVKCHSLHSRLVKCHTNDLSGEQVRFLIFEDLYIVYRDFVGLGDLGPDIPSNHIP